MHALATELCWNCHSSSEFCVSCSKNDELVWLMQIVIKGGIADAMCSGVADKVSCVQLQWPGRLNSQAFPACLQQPCWQLEKRLALWQVSSKRQQQDAVETLLGICSGCEQGRRIVLESQGIKAAGLALAQVWPHSRQASGAASRVLPH